MPSKSGSSPYAKNNDGNKEIEKIISKEGLKNNYIWNGMPPATAASNYTIPSKSMILTSLISCEIPIIIKNKCHTNIIGIPDKIEIW